MRARPRFRQGKPRPVEALERLVQLYDAWGKPEEAAKWRAKMEEGSEYRLWADFDRLKPG